MSKALILISFVSFGTIGTGIFRILLNPANSLHLGVRIALIGVFIYFAGFILFIIYSFRQDQARKHYYRRKGIVIRSYLDLFQVGTQAAKPYKREALLQIALTLTLCLVMISQYVIKLALPTQDYGGSFPLEAVNIIGLTCFLILPLSLLTYAFLTKDLTELTRDQLAKKRKVSTQA